MNKIFTSWRTTLGSVVVLAGIVFGQLAFFFDDDPDTTTNWNLIMAAVRDFIIATGILTIGFNARDNTVTSRMAGAEPPNGDE